MATTFKLTDEIRTILTTTLIVLVILKLTGLIHWSWLWVLAPIWIPIAAFAALFLVGFVIYLITQAVWGQE